MTEIDWAELANDAWEARHSAHLVGKTAVGAAVMSSSGSVHYGCNVEHRYRCHDVHAEVNALTNMVAQGGGPAIAIAIAAERDNFTPCGGCLDWIFELGSPDCLVAFCPRSGEPQILRADQLMPHYPR